VSKACGDVDIRGKEIAPVPERDRVERALRQRVGDLARLAQEMGDAAGPQTPQGMSPTWTGAPASRRLETGALLLGEPRRDRAAGSLQKASRAASVGEARWQASAAPQTSLPGFSHPKTMARRGAPRPQAQHVAVDPDEPRGAIIR
jgi:hypothetical protein